MQILNIKSPDTVDSDMLDCKLCFASFLSTIRQLERVDNASMEYDSTYDENDVLK